MKNTSSLQSFIPSSLHSLISFILLLLIPSFLIAQVPQGIPYQAVIRDNAGAPLVNTPILVRFTLHQNTTDGAVEYQETQSATTNAYGVINTQFGTGTATQGTFAGIVWSNTSKFIQVEANDGNGYLDMGTQQMMSVPYAMYAGSVSNSSSQLVPQNHALKVIQGTEQFIVPDNVYKIKVIAVGGGGGGVSGQWPVMCGGGQSSSGGSGAYVETVIPLLPGDTLNFSCGIGGANANCGSGGNGTHSIVTKNGDLVLRAEGGTGAPSLYQGGVAGNFFVTENLSSIASIGNYGQGAGCNNCWRDGAAGWDIGILKGIGSSDKVMNDVYGSGQNGIIIIEY